MFCTIVRLRLELFSHVRMVVHMSQLDLLKRIRC